MNPGDANHQLLQMQQAALIQQQQQQQFHQRIASANAAAALNASGNPYLQVSLQFFVLPLYWESDL